MNVSSSDKNEIKNGNNTVVQVKDVVKSFTVGDGEMRSQFSKESLLR